MISFFKDAMYLNGYFCDSSIHDLQLIFDEANNNILNEDRIAYLNEHLLSILQQEMSRGLMLWKVSTTGQNHIIISSNICVLLNIHGGFVLFSSWLFFEGELAIKNLHWIEKDNLVVFDFYYIVHDEYQKCVCHFSNDNDRFIFLSSIEK